MFFYRQNQKFLPTEIKPLYMFMNQKKLELGLLLAGPKNTNKYQGVFGCFRGVLGLASR